MTARTKRGGESAGSPGFIKITTGLISSLRTASGGYTKGQLEILGVDWPPEHGWRKRLIGLSISRHHYEELVRLSRTGGNKKKAKVVKRKRGAKDRIEVVAQNDIKRSGSNIFYASDEWRSIRYKALELNGGACQCCGRSRKQHGVVLHVDHILPRSKRPDLALSIDNLQVLCEDCNLGKSNKFSTDWR